MSIGLQKHDMPTTEPIHSDRNPETISNINNKDTIKPPVKKIDVAYVKGHDTVVTRHRGTAIASLCYSFEY